MNQTGAPSEPFFEVVAAVLVLPRNHVLIAQKRHSQIWEFPGGKVEANESLSEAMLRELSEELGLNSDNIKVEAELHSVASEKMRIHFMKCRLVSGIPLPLEHLSLKILAVHDLDGHDFHPADAEFAALLKTKQIQLF